MGRRNGIADPHLHPPYIGHTLYIRTPKPDMMQTCRPSYGFQTGSEEIGILVRQDYRREVGFGTGQNNRIGISKESVARFFRPTR